MKKDILIIAAVILALCVLFSGVEIQSVDEYYLVHLDDITPQSQTVTMSINCADILDNYEKLDDNLKSEKYVPKNGVILSKTEYVLRPGDTVFSILSRVTRHNKIQMEFQGAEKNNLNSVYITGINNLYEFSCGANSGWTFKVNGVYPDRGCSDYVLADGDEIEWIYACSFAALQ